MDKQRVRKKRKIMFLGSQYDFIISKWFNVVINQKDGVPTVYINGVKL
jgi:hypothetical protein